MSGQFDGFSIYLAEKEEGDFLAHFIELPEVSAFGATAKEALTELKTACEAMKESYRKHGETIPIAPTRKE
jgi:predicted RNase H-like HicB family nuclease